MINEVRPPCCPPVAPRTAAAQAPVAPSPSLPTESFTPSTAATDGPYETKFASKYPNNLPPLATAFSLTPSAVTHVLYHANCPDGFGAALAAYEKLGDKAKYIPVSYDNPPPELPKDAKVAIVDFSYPRETLLDLKSKVSDLVVLDHHESAQRHLEGLPFAYFPPTLPSKDGKGDPGHSGATLSWLYFHDDTQIPDMFLYLRDRDNWQWQMEGSHEFSTALASHPMQFDEWHRIGHHIDTLVSEGATIQRFKDQLLDKLATNAHIGVVDGHKVPVCNAPYELASDLADVMKKKYPDAEFVAIYYDDAKGNRGVSLRSTEFDVSKVAEKFGGGGHEHAAAFRVSAGSVDFEPKG